MTAGYSEYADIKDKHTRAKGNGADGAPKSRALSWAQLQALPDPAYVVKGLIDKGALVEAYGAYGSGKSFLVGDIGFHVALGWNWRTRRVNQGGVLFVAAEGGTNIKRRMEAFAKHHKIDLNRVPFLVVLAPTNLLTPDGIAQVIADAEAVPDLAMIIIDTAARVMPGGKEDTEDMGAFVSACDAIRLKTGAAVVTVHHTGKNLDRGSRGSIFYRLLPDSIVEVSKDEKSKTSTAEHTKSRDGETGAKFSFRLEVIPLGHDADGDPITSCVVEHLEETVNMSNGAKLTADEFAYLGDITNYFARAESPIEVVSPMSGSVATRCATRPGIRHWLKHRGRFSVADDGALSATDRSDLRRILNCLRDKGKIGMTEQYIWLL